MQLTFSSTMVIALSIAIVLTIIAFEVYVYKLKKEIRLTESLKEAQDSAAYELCEKFAKLITEFADKEKQWEQDKIEFQKTIREYERELERKGEK